MPKTARRRNTHPVPKDDEKTVEAPSRWFIQAVDDRGITLSSEGFSILRFAEHRYRHEAGVFAYDGFASEVVEIRLVDMSSGETLKSTSQL